MKIDRYKLLKNDMYEVVIGSNTFVLHSDLILKYNLLIRSDITIKELEEYQIENEVYEGYNIALKMLSTKNRSYKELVEALKKKELNPESATSAVDILVRQGYVNDKTYAKYFVHDQVLLTNNGPFKIRKLLEEKGVSSNYIEEALQDFKIKDQEEKIKKLINRQVKSNTNKSSMMLRKKIGDYLNDMGYSYNIYEKYLSSIDINDRDAYTKTLEKVRKELSRKYKGEDLEFRIRQKMYSKGFRDYE